MLTHTELKAKALQNPALSSEYEPLNREDFAILDEILLNWRLKGLGLTVTNIFTHPLPGDTKKID